MTLARLATVLSLAAGAAACGGGSAEGPPPATPASSSGTVTVKVNLGLPKVGNAKYDKFFNDVVDLAQLIADTRATLDNASVNLNTAMKVTGATDFDTALQAASAKLKGKVTVTVAIGPTGATVNVVPVAGVTLSADEQATLDAYKQVVTDVAAVPIKLAPVVAKTVSIALQAVALIASAKQDFTGLAIATTLPSVISGINKASTAIDGIKADLPVITAKSATMTTALKAGI